MKAYITVCCVTQTSICLQSWTDGDVKSVNTHHTLQSEHPSENDWLPFCPLRLSTVMTFLTIQLNGPVCVLFVDAFGSIFKYVLQVSLFLHLGTYIKWCVTFQAGRIETSCLFISFFHQVRHIVSFSFYCYLTFGCFTLKRSGHKWLQCSLRISEPLKRIFLSISIQLFFFHLPNTAKAAVQYNSQQSY